MRRDRILGGVLALMMAGAVTAVSLAKGLPPVAAAWRAAAALALGDLAGVLVFGRIGRSVVKEAAGKPEVPPAGEDPRGAEGHGMNLEDRR